MSTSGGKSRSSISNESGVRKLQANLIRFVFICMVLITFIGTLVEVGAHGDKQQASKWAISKRKSANQTSIVFDLKTPKVFYCPQSKQADESKMIVKSVPLDKLCEFDGEPKPKGVRGDCYNDVDETEFACAEKKRFMIRLEAYAMDKALTGFGSDTDGVILGPVGTETELEYLIPHKPSYSEKKSHNPKI